jgi:hypothetical protein
MGILESDLRSPPVAAIAGARWFVSDPADPMINIL